MRIDLPLCSFKYCKYNFDCNCISKNRKETCEFDIFKKAAEENSKNSGWITCAERLPTMEECLKNDCRFILDDGNRRYEGIYDYIEKQFIRYNCYETQPDKCVIAWQPMPEKYQQ